MKDPRTMTDAELCSLTEDEVSAAIRRAWAEDGIPLVDAVPPEMTPTLIEGDVPAYSVCGIEFCEQAEAEAIADLISRSARWETETRWQYKDAMRTLVKGRKFEPMNVSVHKLVSKAQSARFQAVADADAARRDAKEKHEDHSSLRANVEQEIRARIRAAHLREQQFDHYVQAIGEYVHMADRDYVIARRFFEKAYPGVLEQTPGLASYLTPPAQLAGDGEVLHPGFR